MAAVTSFVVGMRYLIQARGLVLTTPNFKDELMKRARVMDKLLKRGKKKKYYAVQMGSNPFSGPVGNTRRAAVLSNLFMENITDIMSTEECGSQLQGYGIEITHVKVPTDCKAVNVYWTLPSSNYDQVETVSKILKACAGEIRSEMISRHVLGIVPYINFVEDKLARNAAEVERLLSIADYGPDYIPVNSGSLLLQDTIGDLTASAMEKENKTQNVAASDEKTKNQDSDISCLSDASQQHKNYQVPNNLPKMKMDVFNLDYNSIMNQVIHKMKKSYKMDHHEERGVSECVKDIHLSGQNAILNDAVEKRRITLDSFLRERKKLIQGKRKVSAKELLSEYEIEEDNQDDLENSELYVEDGYDENEDNSCQDYLPESDEFNNK